jgi:uncharacterized protein (DUF2062 family)
VNLFDQSLLHEPFWRDLASFLRPLLWPYVVGSLIGGAVMAAIAYPLALGFVTSRRRIHDLMHHKQ